MFVKLLEDNYDVLIYTFTRVLQAELDLNPTVDCILRATSYVISLTGAGRTYGVDPQASRSVN